MPADRCPVCDWPMAATAKDGCVPGNCCFRPREDSDEGRRIAERRRQLAEQNDNPWKGKLPVIRSTYGDQADTPTIVNG